MTNNQQPTKANTMFKQLLDQAQSAEARYLQHSNLTALDESIAAWERILQHPDFAMLTEDLQLGVLNDSAVAYIRRYEARGSMMDIDRALSQWQQFVSLPPTNFPKLPRVFNNLGNGFSNRYAHTGAENDLKQAIDYYQRAKSLTPINSPELPSRLNNLGSSLKSRYVRTGTMSDLEEAIKYYQQAVSLSLSSAESIDLPYYLNNLGNGLKSRYARTGDLSDLQAGIVLFQRAEQLTLKGSPDLPSILNNLGTCFAILHTSTGVMSDLKNAIQSFRRAIDLTTADLPDKPGRLNNLGGGLSILYAHTGVEGDLEEGIKCFQQAVFLTPIDSPEWPKNLNNLGNGLRKRYAHTCAMSDLEEAIRCYQRATQRGLEVALEESLRSARNWLIWAFSDSDPAWEEVTQAYCYAYEAGQRLLKSQLFRTHKESWLKDMQGLASQAAYAFAKLKQPKEAVVALERGIARLLSEALQRDRANLEQLKTAGHIDLRDRYQENVDRYHWAQQQQNVEALKTAKTDLDNTIEDIRQVPGYEDFLKPVEFDLIQKAAQETPLVYILTTSAGGLALIVRKEEITPVWLPNLEDTFAGYWEAYIQWRNTPTNDNLRHHWRTTIETTTQQLWTAVMQPLMNALPPHTHLTLIPVGRLNLLPWHAAWTEDDATGRGYALDKLTIAYAPNAVTVTQCQQWAKLTTVPKLLAISEPHPQPPTAGSLHYSRYATPAICSLFPDNTQQLAREQATVAAVTAQLREAHTLWYFYCHGLTNFEEPLKSGLLLAGSQEQFLTLGDVLNLKVTGVRLATLAACETNIPDLHKLPDEVVSLAAGLLQAGVAGVIASLWSVDAVSTAFLMVRCYDVLHQRWQTDGNMQAPLVSALQEAQRWLRDSTKRELQKWIDQRQLRQHLDLVQQTELDDLWYDKAEEDRPFAAPYYWAAFVAMGC
jgi:CHAT domain-containing protein/TPR repeat protein